MFKKIALYTTLLLTAASCTLSGGSKDDGVFKYITGATKVNVAKDVHVINMFRAIGVPNNSINMGSYKYYQWHYSKSVGVSTLFGGGSTTFYCDLTAETRYRKVKSLNWYGNQCDIFLDQISDYFQDKLNIEVITEDVEEEKSEGKDADEKATTKEPVKKATPVLDLRPKEQKEEPAKTSENSDEKNDAATAKNNEKASIEKITQKTPAKEPVIEQKIEVLASVAPDKPKKNND